MTEIRRVAVYCGSHLGTKPIYRETATLLGRMLATAGVAVVYGGAQVGLMGRVADAALASGGQVVGVLPDKLSDKEVAHKGLTELFVVDGMHTRKALMAQMADAFVVLPGGWGTLEETFEMVTWLQLGYHRKPIVLLDVEGFFEHLIRFADHAESEGFLVNGHRRLLQSVKTAEEVLPCLENASAQRLAT
jgi:uncharacterized protein (TIGR00730 family)